MQPKNIQTDFATETGLSGLYCLNAHTAYADGGAVAIHRHFTTGCPTCMDALNCTGEFLAWERIARMPLAVRGAMSDSAWRVQRDADDWNESGRHHAN